MGGGVDKWETKTARSYNNMSDIWLWSQRINNQEYQTYLTARERREKSLEKGREDEQRP